MIKTKLTEDQFGSEQCHQPLLDYLISLYIIMTKLSQKSCLVALLQVSLYIHSESRCLSVKPFTFSI